MKPDQSQFKKNPPIVDHNPGIKVYDNPPQRNEDLLYQPNRGGEDPRFDRDIKLSNRGVNND